MASRYTARSAYQLVAFLCVLSGMLGMAASMLFLSSEHSGNVAAGHTGFLAGAVLIGSGLIAIALLVRGEEAPLEGH